MDPLELSTDNLIALLSNVRHAIAYYERSHDNIFELDHLKIQIVSAIAVLKEVSQIANDQPIH